MIITLQTLIFFRESFLNAIDRLLRPYYNTLSLIFGRNLEPCDDEYFDDQQVFAEFDEERGVVFYPPMYLQRYAAVSDCLIDGQWRGKLKKVVDLGYHDMTFIKYLRDVQGVECILGVDLEHNPLRCTIDAGGDDYVPKRESPLEVTLFKGNAADPDYRLIGCDAVIAIEMIEHMLPHDLDRLIHTVFGFIKPWIAIFTTPNGDFNVLFKALEKNGLRRLDHFFEWNRAQFHDWCSNIVTRYPQYTVSCKGLGPGPSGTRHIGCCSQMALFVSKEYTKQEDLDLDSLALVSDSPSPNNVSSLISSWETPDIPDDGVLVEPPKELNCTTLEVKKFSKTTLNLMAKNKMYTLAHTREVVDEISQLTKMLNFNKNLCNQLESGTHTWCNINWGENAPYWNQYYEIVKNYNYSYEVTKSSEYRILDLVSDEVNRLVDTQLDEDYSFEGNKLEIPIELLMRAVKHITYDTDKVKGLLEWNGYEVSGDFVVHSRTVGDFSSPASQEDDSPQTTDVYSDVNNFLVSYPTLPSLLYDV